MSIVGPGYGLFVTSTGRKRMVEMSQLYAGVRGGAANIVRVHRVEFPDYLKRGDILTHFNAGNTPQPLNVRTLLARILKPGEYEDRNSLVNLKLPLLTLQKAYLVMCEESGFFPDYDDLPLENFETSMPGIKNIDDLKKAILRRYQLVMPRESAGKILGQGVAYSRFRVIRKLNYIIYPKSFKLPLSEVHSD